jgi:hypothetical protein
VRSSECGVVMPLVCQQTTSKCGSS